MGSNHTLEDVRLDEGEGSKLAMKMDRQTTVKVMKETEISQMEEGIKGFD